jgi:hypothetical protein
MAILREPRDLPRQLSFGDVETMREVAHIGGHKATPRLRPFFGYYGGKWRDAVKHYPPPEHTRIVEPFAASAGYSLRYPDRKVILCLATAPAGADHRARAAKPGRAGGPGRHPLPTGN